MGFVLRMGGMFLCARGWHSHRDDDGVMDMPEVLDVVEHIKQERGVTTVKVTNTRRCKRCGDIGVSFSWLEDTKG